MSAPITSQTPAEFKSRESYDRSQPGFATYRRRIANPSPLGLFAFALTTWAVSLYAVQTRHVKIANLSLALALALGGLTQLLAAMWEFVTGNTYAVTMFGMLSGFYLSAGTIFWAGSGIEDAYEGTGSWTDALVSVVMLVASVRASVVMTTLWSSIVMTIMLAMISAFVEEVKVQKAAGAFGILTSAIAAWAGAAGIWTKDHAFFDLPTGSHRPDAVV
ncbi:GPR1/FUN34/yaaH family domain-containing protein [Rhizoctonia solani AG-1 IA]|uniref:GPR1/FUN34/yaaH family domain-containing protein n=1 Tax=Thanatephorus cucumeris (strain AG1-IA) TaxID=983506 RepID=L8WS61_THACA|nr:GPR1/FUN34/yaaH family domain-containing protein [Rhizoctonia solani AG-1 IA]